MLPFPPYRFGNPAAMGAGFVGPLDGYASNLPLAFSVKNRLLSSDTGYAFNVRRSSDSTTLDIGYNADGTVKTADLLAFTGSGSGYITKLYNKGTLGSAGDASQSTAANQPRIVNAGSLDDGMYFNGSSFELEIASQPVSSYSNGTMMQIASNLQTLGNAGINGRMYAFAGGAFGFWDLFGGQFYQDLPLADRISGSPPAGWAIGGYHKLSNENTGSSSILRIDGSAFLTGAASNAFTGTGKLYIGSSGGSGFWMGNIRSFVLWSDCTNAATRAAALP